MSLAVEQHARARIVTDTADAGEERSAIPVDLRYDPEAAPRSVCLSFPDLPDSAGSSGSPGSPDSSGSPGSSGPPGFPNAVPHDWVFARELLERGLRGPASTSSGDVRVWPSGRVRAVVELHSAAGVAVIQFDSAALARFLRRTYAATAAAAPAAAAAANTATTPPPPSDADAAGPVAR